jgi:hypothetical protein
MRALHILLGLLMLAFIAVQYNDPDGPLWMAIYLVPAVWALLAAFRLAVVRSPVGKSLLWACAVAGLAGVIYYWPTMPDFWRKDVWWVEETAREGMGMMIAFAVMIVVLFSAHRKAAGS